jgi:hypothetical protein
MIFYPLMIFFILSLYAPENTFSPEKISGCFYAVPGPPAHRIEASRFTTMPEAPGMACFRLFHISDRVCSACPPSQGRLY